MSRNARFMNKKVDILRPALSVDVTIIRDRVLVDYVVIQANARCYREASGGDVLFDAQLGALAFERFAFYFPKDSPVQQNDVLKFTHPVTGAIIYYEVRSREDFSDQGFHVRCQTVQKNYHRGQE